jgi:hypothetical protein
VIRAVGKPVGYSNLRVCLARSDPDAWLLTVGKNLLQAQLVAAENSDKCDKNDDLGLLKNDNRWPRHGQLSAS